jgi:predicted P-loop ATPase
LASTNHFDFLTDETGSVRWIIFNVLNINHDNGGQNGYCQIDINKVWAQAYAFLKDGFKCELTHDEINQTELLNRRFIRVTPEMELITKYFKSSPKDSIQSFFHTSTTLEKNLREKGYKTTHIQLGRALKMLGFQQEQKYNNQLRYQEKGYWLQEI